MIIGVAGSKRARSENAMDIMEKLFEIYQAHEIHHGDRFGFDEQINDVAKRMRLRTVIHPIDDESQRAHCKGTRILDPAPYLQINLNLVDMTDFLIYAPDGPQTDTSGTWAAFRHSKKIRGPRKHFPNDW